VTDDHLANIRVQTKRYSTPMQLSNTPIYKFCLFVSVIIYLDPISFTTASPYAVPLKYIYTSIIVVLILMYFVAYRSILADNIAPLLALFFYIVTMVVFLFNLTVYGYRLSYTSAFTSSLVLAAAAFMPRSGLTVDAGRILRHLLWLFLFCSYAYVFEAAIKLMSFGQAVSFNADPEFGKSIVAVVGLALAFLQRRASMALLFLLSIALALVLRPSTTVVLALSICLPLTLLLRRQDLQISRVSANTALCFAAVSPFILYAFYDQISDLLQTAESTIKTEALGGQTNTRFRLIVINKALQQLIDGSLLYGNALDGNTTVFIGNEIPSWFNFNALGIVTIHSDFVIVLSQAGLIGYALFIAFFAIIINTRFRSLYQVNRHSDEYTMLSISIISIVGLLVIALVNPFLQNFFILHPIWTLMFVSELARQRCTHQRS
jgi:hypothetical protein